MTGLKARSAIWLGTIIRPYIVSAKVRKKSSLRMAPIKMIAT